MSTGMSDPPINETLAEQKLRAEIEKLHEENKKIRESAWRSPTVLIAAGALLLSLFGNAVQYRSTVAATATADRQLAIAESKWNEEQKKLSAEIETLQVNAKREQEQEKTSSEARQKDEKELEEVNKALAIWNDELFRQNVNLGLLESKASQYELAKRPEMAEAARKGIEVEKNTIASMNQERNMVLARKSELEKRLGSQP